MFKWIFGVDVISLTHTSSEKCQEWKSSLSIHFIHTPNMKKKHIEMAMRRLALSSQSSKRPLRPSCSSCACCPSVWISLARSSKVLCIRTWKWLWKHLSTHKTVPFSLFRHCKTSSKLLQRMSFIGIFYDLLSSQMICALLVGIWGLLFQQPVSGCLTPGEFSCYFLKTWLSSWDSSGCLMVKMMELKEQYILVAPQFWLGYHLKIYLQFRHSSWTRVRCWGWAAERETRGPFFRTAGVICHGELKSTFSKIHFCESIIYIYILL